MHSFSDKNKPPSVSLNLRKAQINVKKDTVFEVGASGGGIFSSSKK